MSIAPEMETPTAAATATTNSFHVTLCVADLGRAVRFYEILFGQPPALQHGHYARFELAKPALIVVLYASPRPPGGALNHVGLRVGTSAELVEIQQRLESAGIATQLEDGVECCYAKQTKFWVTDPDRVLWELYILHDDLDHSGFDDQHPKPAPATPAATWVHRLMEPLPERIPQADSSLDEVRLEGTFNLPLDAVRRDAFLGEVQRVLRPGGRIVVHGLLGDRPFPGEPKLPGLASLVRFVPVDRDVAAQLQAAGFVSIFFETLSDVNCIGAPPGTSGKEPSVDLRHGLVVGIRPAKEAEVAKKDVVYRGPFAQVCDERGCVYPRGQRVSVNAAVAEQLQRGPAADQFAFLQK